jgi:serine/threonine-protein kinase 24/25/MST4
MRFCREEPKQESDLDDPWIMTVKGNHSIKLPQEDLTPNHKITNKIQNGSGPTIAKSPPKDSNLNHYRADKATPSARPQSVVQSPSDNRKERDRDRERERESKDREKRISRELSPLDHRGDAEIEKKSSNRRTGSRDHSNGGKADGRSPCLSAVIYPLMSEVSVSNRRKR